MKKILFIAFFTATLSACDQKKAGELSTGEDSVNLAIVNPDSINFKTDAHYFWSVEPDMKSNKLLMKKAYPLTAGQLTADHLIGEINTKYPRIKLDLVKISNDTIFVTIRKSDFLTQQMGTTGADLYMTETTYNLSELKNISYVDFDFIEGDHASPGTYSRTSFINVKEDTE